MTRLLMLTIVSAIYFAETAHAQRAPLFEADPACHTLNLASIDAPAPRDRNTLIVRWLATSNFEIAYRDNVFLLDTYYDRTPPARPLGFDFMRMRKATAIFIGHAHDDHISDAVAVAKQTGAPVYGGPQSQQFVIAGGLPTKQAMLTKGGETLKFNGVTVQAVLAHHSVRNGPQYPKAAQGFRAMQDALLPPRTPEQEAHERAINQRGSRDPKLQEEGTIGFLFTFDNGYRLYYQDSAGPITAPQQALAAMVAPVDMAVIAYQGFYLSQPQIDATMPLVRLWKPRALVLNHHDETGGRFLDMATEPFFMAVRDEMPQTRGYGLLYRSPMCVDSATKQVFVGP
jgi:hypothetical protein